MLWGESLCPEANHKESTTRASPANENPLSSCSVLAQGTITDTPLNELLGKADQSRVNDDLDLAGPISIGQSGIPPSTRRNKASLEEISN